MRRAGWLVTGVPEDPTDGGKLRAHHVFRELVSRTGAEVVRGSGGRATAQAVARRPRLLRSQLAAANMLNAPRGWSVLRRLIRPSVLDLHDEPLQHLDALGITLSADERRRMRESFRPLVDSFETVVVQTTRFAELCDMDGSQRVVVIPNGTDTTHIKAEAPNGDAPTIGMVSGAAPGRGIETLVTAAELLRESLPELRLNLGLIATGHRKSADYLEGLKASLAGHTWIRIDAVPYSEISRYLGDATVLTIPHPPHAYWDAILPIKLFDCMAAGRPIVATPRTETAGVLTTHDAGVTARSDRPEDLAAALRSLLTDSSEAARMGGNARAAAETHYEWRVLSRRLADEILGPIDEGQNVSR